MTRKEFKEIVSYEIYRDWPNQKPDLINRIRIKYFQPNTNCTYLARKMWFLQSGGGISKLFARILYLRICRRYGCCIFRTAEVARGFYIEHPVGIVIGDCTIGENCHILQNVTIGIKNVSNKKQRPIIGNNVRLCCGSSVLGNCRIEDDVTVGANSVVINDLTERGSVYAGIPARLIKKI